MYAKFKEASSKKDREELRRFVESASADELSAMIAARIGGRDAPEMVDEILGGFGDDEASRTKRRGIAEAVLRALRRADVSASRAESVVRCVARGFPSYSEPDLVELAEFFQDRIRLDDDDFASWKDALPLILRVLENEKYISYRGNEVSGAEYKSLIVASICNGPWQPAILTSLAKMFGEISLERSDREIATRALCDKLRDAEPNELPPLVHQLLRLATSHDCGLLLGTLQKYFAAKYEAVGDGRPDGPREIGVTSLKEIREIESTVLYHVYQAARLDHARLKDFVVSLKKVTNAPKYVLEPFLMAVLLSVSNVYEDQIFEILKQAMRRKIQDDEKRKSSAWLRKVLSDDWSVVEVVERVITNSDEDRHLILNGLVEFAFVLMDARVKDDERQLCDIGIRIVQKLIRRRHEIGPVVLQKLTDRIVSGGSAISQYTECLSYMCRKLIIIVLDSQAWVIILLEQLTAIPGDAAKQVLRAVLPVMRVSSRIRDTLVLILRKALYRKGTHTRQMAVVGFLELLKNLKINDLSALSQSGQSSSASGSTSIFTQVTLERRAQTTTSNARCNAILCHEVLSILKRCFTHEVQVRAYLYQGLYEAILMNPELSEYATDMLMSHFNVYYETDPDVKPALKFHLCSDVQGPQAVLREPIGQLIFAMQRIYVKAASRNSPLFDKAAIILESLCKRMPQTELEHLNLDENTDLPDNVPKSQQKLHSLKLTMTVCEALIAYRIAGWSINSVNVAQNVNGLFKTYNELVEFAKRVAKPKKGKPRKDKDANDASLSKRPGRPVAVKLPETIMDLETIHRMLRLLYEPSVPWTSKDQAELLKKRSEFHHYALRTAVQLFQNAKTLKNADLPGHRDVRVKDYADIGRLVYERIIRDSREIRNFDEQTGILELECFKELCDLACAAFGSDLPEFLAVACRVEASHGLPAQIRALAKSLEPLIIPYFEEESDDRVLPRSVPVIVLDVISILLRKVDHENSRANEVFDWLKNLAERRRVETPIAALLVQLLTTIEERDDENGTLLDELCTDLCAKLGTIDENEGSRVESFECLTESSGIQIHGALSAAIKYKLANASWLLARLKSEHFVASAPGLGDETDRENLREKERGLCRQLSRVVQTLRSLASAAIEPGPNTDSTFKNLQQLYKLISDLTKYFCNKSTPQNPAFQSVKFVQLVELAGKSLKLVVYNLITHTEEHQNTRRGKSDSHAQRNRVIKETKMIPAVIYSMESFQKEILQLGKKTGIPLENHIKHSVTRDYRINNPQLVEGLEKLDVSLS